ncbi:MAG: hypothetical protein DRQ55_09685 [Planctomycetota bacterium]|nr:MAG: hypothetical protein DRQ55_09685 [Planctomycetota bacterium]
MSGRIPPDEALEFYVNLGPERSYAKVGKQYGVSKRSVTKHAAKHGWSRRLLEIEASARERNEARMVDAVDEMNKRHLQTAKVIQAKGLEALRAMPIDSAMGAVRALDIALKQERLVLGEPTDRNAVAIEDVIKREAARWLGPAGADEDWGSFASDGHDEP